MLTARGLLAGAFAALALLVLGACASSVNTAEYHDRLLKTLSNQREISYRNEKTYPGKILCGRYEALGDNGFNMVTRDFVVGAATALSRPTQEQIAVYCSDDAEQALYDTLGIGGENADWSKLLVIPDDMAAIDLAIRAYYRANNRMPPALETLLEGSFGVEENNLRDPWGQAYTYIEGLSGRSTPRYELFTLGSDKVPGGTGEEADISVDQLELLRHVLALRKP